MLCLHRQLDAFLGADNSASVESAIATLVSKQLLRFDDAALRAQNAKFKGAAELPAELSGPALFARCVVQGSKCTGNNALGDVVKFFQPNLYGQGRGGSQFKFCNVGIFNDFLKFEIFCAEFMKALYPDTKWEKGSVGGDYSSTVSVGFGNDVDNFSYSLSLSVNGPISVRT